MRMRAPEAERFFRSLEAAAHEQAAHKNPGAGRHHRHAARRFAAPCRWGWAPTISWRRCPLLGKLAEIEAETVSRVGSHSLSFDQIHALAARIASLKADGVVVTQGTDTLEETGFLLDLLLDLDIPVIVTAAMRNPALTSPDGPGNLLAAVRVACDPWVRAHARALGVMAVMLDEVYAAADVLKVHPTRLNAFASPQTGPLAALVEDRVVPLGLPVRDAIEAARASDSARSRRQGRAGGAAVDGRSTSPAI